MYNCTYSSFLGNTKYKSRYKSIIVSRMADINGLTSSRNKRETIKVSVSGEKKKQIDNS